MCRGFFLKVVRFCSGGRRSGAAADTRRCRRPGLLATLLLPSFVETPAVVERCHAQHCVEDLLRTWQSKEVGQHRECNQGQSHEEVAVVVFSPIASVKGHGFLQ